MKRPVPIPASLIGAALAILVGLAQISFAAGSDITRVGSADHPGFGRITIELGGAKTFRLDQIGDRVVVHFTSPVSLERPPSPPRNVLTLNTNGATADFTVLPGARVHPAIIANTVVFDILDPPVAASPATGVPVRRPVNRRVPLRSQR
jgi:hypothetical protein